MTYVLWIYTIVAATNWQGTTIYRDWRYMGEFKNEVACLHAARTMGVHGAQRIRCLPTDTVPRTTQQSKGEKP